MSGNTILLEVDSNTAAFIAGSTVRMLRDSKNNITAMVGLRLLNQLADRADLLENDEVKQIVDTAVDTAAVLAGEVMTDEYMDVIETPEATFAM